MQQLSGASLGQPQAKTILPLRPAEWTGTPVAPAKKSILPVDVTDNTKSLSEVGKEDQPTVSASPNPTATSSTSQYFLAKSSQPPKSEVPKEDKGSATSQASAKATSVLPASVESITSARTKPPTVKMQEESKPREEAPNAQSVEAPSALNKGDANLAKLQKNCPICKEVFKNEPPNYNTCRSCKSTVCNICAGLNSRAEINKEQDWLCVNCQREQSPGPHPAKTTEVPLTESEKEAPISDFTKEKTSIPVGDTESDQIPTVNGRPQDKLTLETTPRAIGNVAEDKEAHVEAVETQNTKPPEKQSGLFGFSFGSTKSHPPSPQVAASAASRRIQGFGSSFLSSASNLISSAVQDEPSITPPTSRKGSTISLKNTTTPPLSRRSSATQQHGEKKETENKLQDQPTKESVPPLKKDTACLELLKACPLCKADIKDDPPNYNTCTQCKNIVCNLCGFSPIPQETEVSEWLCLSCQMQRAPGPPPAKTQSEFNKVPSPASPKKHQETPAASAPMKSPSLPVNAKDEKPTEAGKPVDKPISAESQKSTPPTTQPSPAKSAPPQKAEPPKEESSLFGFSFGGTRSRPPSPQPDISAVSGKVRGFGSSFLSSASNLISSAVQQEPSTTPPTSRKASTTSQTSVKLISTSPTSHKKQVEKIEPETKLEVELPKADTSLAESLKACPICKADFKKDPPNYATCTECQKTVCKLCVFSPVQQETKVKKLLCLDCKKKRAPGPQPKQPQLEEIKIPPTAPKQDVQTTDNPQKEPNVSVDATMKAAEVVRKEDKFSAAESQKPTAVQSAQQSSPDIPGIPKKEEKSFFGFSTGVTTSPSLRPDTSAVSGKARGFGSSFFSSASNLISSALQDETSTTPPTSRKGSIISQRSEKDTTTADALHKGSSGQKEEQKTEIKISSVSPTLDEPLKPCPLCKVALTKDPPNYDICTECKTTVCNLCGFSSMPQQSEVKEWLCLNCQMQRVPGASLTQAQLQADKVPTPASPQQKVKSLAGKPEDKPTPVETNKSISTPAKQQSTPPTPKVDASKKESGFFGFGGARSRSPSPQPAVAAVSGKVLGFGSSLFSTASNLISSTVHDEPTTPPTPRKGSTTSQASVKTTPAIPPSSQKESVEQEKHPTKEPDTAAKVDSKPSAAKKQENKLSEKEVKMTKLKDGNSKMEDISKHQDVACPLCKIVLNVGSNEAPNYNTCTECKNTVCNLCGFNPTPHQTEIYEWLCLNCQTQRALKGTEPQEPQTKPDIVSSSTLSRSTITPKTSTNACDSNTKDLRQVQESHEQVSSSDQNKASNLSFVQNDNISNTDTTKKKDDLNDLAVKKAQEKETPADTKEESQTKGMQSSEAIMENQKSVVSLKPGTDQEPTEKSTDGSSDLEKPEQLQSKSSIPNLETSKQESGLFDFGFSSNKSKSTPSKPSDTSTGKLFDFGGRTEAPSPQSASSVSGKVLGFGSSIFSSASNLISSAVHDGPSITPPSSRKGSTVSQTSIKIATPPSSRKGSTVSQASLKTPPTSRKGSATSQSSLKTIPTGDTKASDSQKQDEQAANEKSKVKLKEESAEAAKLPYLQHVEKAPDEKADMQTSPPLLSASVLAQSSCPICKVKLNMASDGQPNFSTCTKCNSNVCNQCGFDPMPNQTKVKQWLCINCQKQRAEESIEPTGSFIINPQPTLLKKDSQLPTLENKLADSSLVCVGVKTPSVSAAAKEDHQKSSLNENVLSSNNDLPQQNEQEEKPRKSQKQVVKGTASPGRSTPPSQAKVPQQQSSFFGFGKSQPATSKSSESTTGKRFGFAGLTETARSRSPSPQSMTNVPGKFLGFGSSIFSSASTLISSALQDESSPPVSRKASVVSQSSTPPSSRKGSIVPTGEPKTTMAKKLDDKSVEKKMEEPNVTKAESSVTEKQEAIPESVKVFALTKPSKSSQPTCPLCKVEINVGLKEPPNYNTCTECKVMVCNLCGFNPMPHLAEGEWLCLNCQTQRALSGNLGDMGQIPTPLPTSETESAALPKALTIKISEVGQATETHEPAVIKPKTEIQIVTSKVEPVEAVAAPSAFIQSTLIETADKTDEMKSTPAEPTVTQEKLTTEVPIKHVSFPEAETLQEEPETPPTDVVITSLEMKSKTVQPLVKTNDEPTQLKPLTVKASLEFKETCELTSTASKLADDFAFPDQLNQNEEHAIQLKITPTTPCESESIVISVLGEETNNLGVNDKKHPQGHKLLPVSPESYSSSEEELKEIQRASEILLKETESDLAHFKETVLTKDYFDSGDEELRHSQLKEASADKDLSSTHLQGYITKHEVSDADTDREAEKTIKQLNVPEKSADSCLLSQEQEGKVMQPSPVYKTAKTFLQDENEKEETTETNSAKAIFVQDNVRQISEEESLVEDISKDGGSSSMQVSHITSGTTSPTTLSSLGEESDSSPGHKKENLEGKRQRKVKHRQGQPLQNISDSSEEEEILEEGDQFIEQEIQRENDQRQFKKPYKKSNKEKDKLQDHPPNSHFQTDTLSQAEDVVQISEINTYETFSYSNISPSTDSEQENVVTHEPPPMDVEAKPLKSADEAYEEIMQKAQELKAMTKKITPPDIEPLYGGMLIEDYVYESLVEEPAQAMPFDYNATLGEYLTDISVPETLRKLRTPDEAYEEMQKNRELMLKDQAIEHAQVYRSASNRDTTGPIVTDTCFVNISETFEFTKQQDENWQWYAETASDELLNREKDVMTSGTSPTQSTPLSPVSPLSLSEPLYDSAEIIQIPSSGEEDNDKNEFAAEPIECVMEPYRTESTPQQDQSVKNVLYPIPDLKITQCSSGEEEVEEELSITQEHEIIMVNGIAQCDDGSEEPSEFIESSVEVQSVESEPTSVVSEVPLSKSALEHEPLTYVWDSQTPPLPSLDLTAFSSGIIDQPTGQTSIPTKLYADERQKPCLPSDSTFVTTQLELQVASFSRANKPVIEFPPPPTASPPALPPDSLPNVPFNQQSMVPTTNESVKSMASQSPRASVKEVTTTIHHKSPPPVPPKPFCHKSKEGIKPSVISESAVAQVGYASTFPRTKEPPKALTLSLVTPTDIKHSISSPKSPLSPRFAKTLETYVVITLPSEPGSPVEGVTTQAPIHRPSLPTPKQQCLASVSTTFIPPVTVFSHPELATPPRVIPASVFTPPSIPVQTGDSAPDFPLKTAIHNASAMISTKDLTVVPASSAVLVQDSVTPSPVFVPQTSVLPLKMYEEKPIYSAPPLTTTVYSAETVVSIPTIPSPFLAEIPDMTIEPKINTVSVPHSIATSLAFPYVHQVETAIQPIKKETFEEKAICSVSPVTATIYPAPAVVSMPTVSSSSIVAEIPDMTVQPKISTMSTVISLPATNIVSVPPCPAFVPQIETDAIVSIKSESIYSASPMSSAGYPTATVVPVTSSDTFLVGSVMAEIPAMTIESKINNMSTVISGTEECTAHILAPQTNYQPVVPASLPFQELPVEVKPATVAVGITPALSREPLVSYDIKQGREMQLIHTVYPAPVAMTKLSLSTDKITEQILEMEEDVRSTKGPPLDHIQQHQIFLESQQMVPPVSDLTYTPTAPGTFSQIEKSVESQEIRGTDKVLPTMSHLHSTIATTEQHQYALPNILAQVVTTEVQRTTTVSVVQECIPLERISDSTYRQAAPKQSGKTHCIDDVIDLTTLKLNVSMTDKGMDLTAPESNMQSFFNDSSSRQITAVQPEIVNLTAEITPATTLSIVTDSITVVTCTATFAYNKSITVDTPSSLQSVTSTPLPLKTYKPFEPLAQIIYRPVNSQPKPSTDTEIPINLTRGPPGTTASLSLPITMTPVICTPSPVSIHNEPPAAIDLTMSKPKKTMLAITSSTGVVTSIVEEDMAPVDLTAGRRTVCCDILYRLPFTGSCRTQPPVASPDKQFDQRNDQHITTTLGLEDLSNLKTVGYDSNVIQTDLVTKTGSVGQNDALDGAIDLTSSKMSRDKALDYSKKGMSLFGITTSRSYQEISSGNSSVQSPSNKIVYSSVAPPIPSTCAITTQPGSIFSTTCNSLTTMTEPFSTQIQTSPYNIINSSESIYRETDSSKNILPSALASLLPSISAFPELYADATLEVIAASLDALISPNFPTFDDSKSQQYQAEHEFLQLEKLKQLCLAEELEWERQEIQRYREQEQIIVQKELEELQSIKQQLLMQQEEERKAHFILQQETFTQQQLQLEQIQMLQHQLHQQLQEQNIYPYSFDGISHSTSSGVVLDSQYCRGDNGQYWPVKDDNKQTGDLQHSLNRPKPEDDLKEIEKQKQDAENLPDITKQDSGQNAGLSSKKISSNCVQTDEEEGLERLYPGRKRRSRKSVDSCVQTDDEDQDEWDVPVRSRRRSRSSRCGDGEKPKGSKVSSIAIQTVAEISVQTDHSGTLKRSPIRAQVDTTFDLHRGGEIESDSDFMSDKDKKHSAVNTHIKADSINTASVPKSSKVLYFPVSPVSPGKGTQKMLTAEPPRHPSSPRSLKASQRSLSDPKSLSPTTDDRIMYQYTDGCSSKGSQNTTPVGSHKKIKRTLPHPPPDEDTGVGPLGYSTGSSRRRMCRNTTMARAKILQDIDKELDLVERESSKLRKKQAELDEEEKEIDAKLRYLEMGINRRKEALLKEREKRERAYLQGVAEDRDYMSDSEISNNRETRGSGHGMERPRTAPQSEFDQFIPPQTEAESQYAQLAYSHYQYTSQSDSPNHYSQQTLYQQPSLYHQQVSPYQTQSIYSSVPAHSQQSQQTGYDHASQLLLMQQKSRQTTLSDLEQKITTNYEVIRNQPLLIVPTSTENAYGVSHLSSKYNNLDLRIGLEERGSMASSPMSSISAESFYADIDHHNVRNYVMIDDIGELTKGSRGLGSSFNVPDKDISKSDRLLRVADVRRTPDVTDFIGPLQTTSRLHYGKPEEDSMEEPYELKLLKQQIKQEFRRGSDTLEQLTGLSHYLNTDSFRHFPKSEKYSIGRLTLEKQAAKQLSASVLYQKQLKNKRTLIDPKITKFSPIQEGRDLEPDYSSFLSSTGSAIGGLSSRGRLLQDEITFGLRKNLAEQQKYLGSTLNLGHSLNLGPNLRSSLPDDGTYPSGTRSRPSSRPSSIYGLDLSIKRDLSSSSLRLKSEGEVVDSQFGIARVKPTSLPISQSRGRIPIVAQNSEEESPLSPVGQPMGMARASAGPLPPISADSRDQFGSSHSLPEVQQHMREESRTRGYDRDIAFIMDDLQGAMSDSEAGGPSWKVEAYHLQHEETDWFDKPREGRSGLKPGQDKRQVKTVHYPFPHTRVKIQRDPRDHSVSGRGFGIRVVGGKEIPGTNREIGAYIANLAPAGTAELSGKVVEGMQVLEWNGIPLMGKTHEEVQSIVGQQSGEVEICLRLDLNMCSDLDSPKYLELQSQLKVAEHQRSPGVDPKQLAAELQKVSQQQAPSSVLTALEKAGHVHSATASAASSGVPSPGQPGSPSVSKKRHNKSGDGVKPQPHPITGEIQLQINYDKNMGNLIVHVLQARNLAPRDNNGYSDPFVKVYLLPGRGQVMVVQNASAENKRRTKYVQKTQNPEWNQTVIYKNIHLEQLKRKTLEVTVWDYAKYSSNDFLGEVLIDLSNTAQLDNMPRWHPLKEQSESIHGRGHPPQGGGGGSGGQGGQAGHGGPGGSGGPGGTGGQPNSEQSPKTSVIKSRSHGIFPDPAKDTQVPTIEKSHSSPGSSKSSSESHLRSHGPSRSQSKSSVTQAHLEDAGNAIAAAEAAVHQARFQPNRVGHIMNDGDEYTLDSEDGTGTNTVDSAIFQVPQLKTIPNGLDLRGADSLKNLHDSESKNHMIGEIKVALKKEMKTEGEQLVLEILQCRNITYKFKSPDHLPDLYVKLYVVNVATQKRIIKKKTRVCRHDREPSFNETFRFSLNPAGHSIQLFLVSNGGKFVKKTLIGEAYIWLDKVDMRKRAVSWHKLVASSPHTQP
ncbi:protein piccolo [Clarias gariepinus]|uniref:protein piccolo n=1 Tax=Clarias gariepinus TaxID=13013 RepID=UPI00234D1549|nr:protein piccolo [Clarias gariepinus]